MTHHTNKAGQPVNQQMLAALPFAILPDELKALNRFHECVTDGEGYDVPKEMMKRLAEIGLVRRVTANIYEHTNFGLSVLNSDFDIAAAEAAQPVVHGPYDVAFIGAGVWAGIPDELPPELVGKKVWLLTQHPASAQPVAAAVSKQNVGAKPVRNSYFLCRCDKCGWLGSSEETRFHVNHGYGDGDYFCPACGAIEPEEVISAAAAFNAMLSAAQKGGAA